MNDIEILKWVITGILGIAIWFIKRTIDGMDGRMSQLTKDLQETKQTISVDLNSVRQNYLHRDDFKEFKVELRQMFEEIKQDLKEFKKHV